MNIFLIRHGESIGNAKGIHQGQKNDFPLSETGKEQASNLRERFKNIKIDAVYSSDLLRAKETAEILAKDHDTNIFLDKRLRERDFGVIGEEEDIMRGWNSFLKQQIEKGINPREATPEGGESDKDHFDRVNAFFEDLRENHKEDENIIIVAHGGTNKIVFGVIGHLSLEKMYKTPQGNTCVNELILNDRIWKVNKINCIDHLSINPELIKEFEKVRNEPLNVINNRCWEKNLRLKGIFDRLGYKTKYKICSFLWSEQKIPKKIIDKLHEDLDHHLYLEVKINGLKLIVDASNDRFLPEYNSWDGKSNCDIGVIPKNFIEENFDKIFERKINEKYSADQQVFFKEINSFFDRLRKSKSILKCEKE